MLEANVYQCCGMVLPSICGYVVRAIRYIDSFKQTELGTSYYDFQFIFALEKLVGEEGFQIVDVDVEMEDESLKIV